MKTFPAFLLWLAPFCLAAQSVDTSAINREVDSLIQISRALTGKGDFDKALEVNAAAEKLALEKLGQESAAYGSVCFNHGRVLYIKGDFPEAEKWYLESKAIREKTLGKEHLDYAKSLNNLAAVYNSMGNYEKAEPLWVEALAIREKVLGKENTDYANILFNLAALYQSLGKYEKAEPLILEALAIEEKVLGKEDPHYAQSLTNLANVYESMGKYEKAEELYFKALTIQEKKLGKGHPDYAGSLIGLAALYHSMGNYEKAEPLYLEALAIREKTLGKEHPKYAQSLHNLAVLYHSMGNYEKAESLYLEALAIREKTLGKEHPEYALSLFGLATLYYSMGNYEKVEPLYLEALAIGEKVLGKENSLYTGSLHNLALLYSNMGNYEKAEPLHLEALVIREKTLGKEHPEYARSLHNLATLYYRMGNYEKVEPLCLEAKAIREKVLGKEHPDYALSLNNLAFLNWSSRNFDAAESYLLELIAIQKNLLLKASRHLSERELTAYIRKLADGGNELFSFAQTKAAEYPLCYDNILFYKGFLLNAVSQVGKLAQSDSATAEKYYLFKSYHCRLAALYAKPIAERDSANVTDLEEKANALEKELARTVAGFGEALRQVNWQEVQAALQPGEAAIEFVRYEFVNPKPTDSVMYAALVLLPAEASAKVGAAAQPQFIPLFEEKQLDSLLGTSGERRADYVSKLYTLADRGLVESPKSLCELLWRPLEKELLLAEGMKANKEIKTIYYSPSGLLHRLNLGAIPISADSTLADKYRLIQLGSTRSLAVGSGNSTLGHPATATAILFGGVRYEMDSTAIRQANNNLKTESPLAGSRGASGFAYADSLLRSGVDWNYLPHTEKEVAAIGQMMKPAGLTAQLHKGFDATEESFKAIGRPLQGEKNPSPRILHIATHGFFFPDPKEAVNRPPSAVDRELVFKISDDPMMRSGLILTGANYAWKTGKPLRPDMEDGILTAYEISQMNLSNTELVVLSACETGLGQIQGNEGVYGLQRAFKIAGVKYLIMSLWRVNDQTTRELMTAFYRQWLVAKKTIPDAFRAAQQAMRERYPDNPFYWAGFVLVE